MKKKLTDEKMRDFRDAKTVWVKLRGTWTEGKPIRIDLVKDEDGGRPWGVYWEKVGVRWFTEFELKKPVKIAGDWEICLCWDNESEKELRYYNPIVQSYKLYMNIDPPPIHQNPFDHIQPLGIFIPEAYRILT